MDRGSDHAVRRRRNAIAVARNGGAARRGVSQSQFVAELIRQATAEVWPAEVLALAGSSSDFQLADALRAGMAQDAERSGP